MGSRRHVTLDSGSAKTAASVDPVSVARHEELFPETVMKLVRVTSAHRGRKVADFLEWFLHSLKKTSESHALAQEYYLLHELGF